MSGLRLSDLNKETTYLLTDNIDTRAHTHMHTH